MSWHCFSRKSIHCGAFNLPPWFGQTEGSKQLPHSKTALPLTTHSSAHSVFMQTMPTHFPAGSGCLKWKLLKLSSATIGARITRITPIARLTPRFFFPMVADVNKVNGVNLVLRAPSMVL
jgi:hypothetical protein